MSEADLLFRLWVYLSASPLLWLTVTVGCFVVAQKLATFAKGHPLVNPVLLTIVILSVLLRLSGTSYQTFFEGAQFVHFLLGPATVALAVPLYQNRAAVIARFPAIIGALLAGAGASVGIVIGMSALFALEPNLTNALVPKSVTSGISMGIAQKLGADPALTAVFVVLSGIIGSLTVTPVMNLIGIKDYAARGFAVGLAAHGIGTARAFQVSAIAGTFAGLAMALNGLITAVLIALVL